MYTRPSSLLLTKLNRPPVTGDRVDRPRLIEMLDRGLRGPLTLVSAAAGFGKTTLVSAWIEELTVRTHTPIPTAWLSLDENDSDLEGFLRYFVAAIRTVFPTACAEVSALLEAPQPVSQTPFVVALSNDMESLPARCVLVLDDYHAIHGVAVHDFLGELLRHWPQRLHLVLLTRNSPPLPLANLRAAGRVVEIRTRDLRFTPEESAAFLAKVLKAPLSQSAVTLLDQRIEGWIAGLRLATVSLRTAVDAETAVASLAVSDSDITDFLMDQVISHQPPEIFRFLLVTSILDRFCVPLCECVVDVIAGSDDPSCDVRSCIERLERANLFVIPLSDNREWYRYHHLFQELLQQRLAVEMGSEQVTALHRAVADWFAGQGLIEEALHHALAVDDRDLAARLMQAGLCDVLNREDRATLIRWLRLLPDDFIQHRPWLLMIKAVALQFSAQLPVVWKLLGQIEAMIDTDGEAALDAGEALALRELRGLVAALRSQEAFSHGQAARAIAYSEEALTLLPQKWRYARGGALMFWGMSMRAIGQGEIVHRRLMDEYESLLGKPDAYTLRILFPVCVNALEAGDLDQVRQTAQALLEQATLAQLAILQGWAHYFLGVVHYHWNELDAAAYHFEQIIHRRYAVHSEAARNSLNGLTLVHLARSELAAAWQSSDLLYQLDMERTGQVREDALSLRARLEVAQGNTARALRWVEAYPAPAPDRLINWVQDPHLAKAQILLTLDTETHVQAALEILQRLEEYALRACSPAFRLKILALRAVALEVQGQALLRWP
ncbi:MAG: hypothetical protein IPK16_23925 [Anaerolineales bacterium]|nr:hypothetical protein [Anaerolineales bacterium]